MGPLVCAKSEGSRARKQALSPAALARAPRVDGRSPGPCSRAPGLVTGDVTVRSGSSLYADVDSVLVGHLGQAADQRGPGWSDGERGSSITEEELVSFASRPQRDTMHSKPVPVQPAGKCRAGSQQRSSMAERRATVGAGSCLDSLDQAKVAKLRRADTLRCVVQLRLPWAPINVSRDRRAALLRPGGVQLA